jgi:hypothetical protein
MKSQTLIGRHNEHRQLIVEDEGEMSYKLIWWGGGNWPIPEWLEGQTAFDLAYTARTSDYRGQPEVQIEWIDVQPAAGQAIEVMTKPVIAIQDYRRAAQPLLVLRRLLVEGDVQVWAEGEARQKLAQAGVTASDRHTLEPGLALAAVTPLTIYLFAIEPETGVPERFLERLAGLVKYALNAKQGHVDLVALSAAVAQSESAVRAGLAWLHSRGSVVILGQSGGQWLLGVGEGREQPDAAEQLARVKEALAESAAFRAYYQRLDAEGMTVFIS